MIGERWVPVEGFPDYEVGSLGHVRRVGMSHTSDKRRLGTFLGSLDKSKNMRKVGLRKDGKSHFRLISGLVARAFLGPPPSPKAFPWHKNDDTTDDRASNLEWATSLYNKSFRREGGEVRAPRQKLSNDSVRAIRRAQGKVSRKALSEMYSVCERTIRVVQERKVWKDVLD
jgi:DNA-binding transcriptional regulator YiaG